MSLKSNATLPELSVKKEHGIIGLYADGTCQGRANFDYTPMSRYMQVILREATTRAKGRRALIIGGGACIIPTNLSAKGFTVDVVDPDKRVFKIAKKHFGYKQNGKHFMESGHATLIRPEKYDVIVLDATDGYMSLPSFYQLNTIYQIYNKLAVNGVFLSNLIPHHYLRLTNAVADMRLVFGNCIIENIDEVQFVTVSEKRFSVSGMSYNNSQLDK